MPIGSKQMPLLEHLDELRRRIVVIVLTILVLSSVGYVWAWQAYELLIRPIMPLLHGQGLHYFSPFEPFTVRFKVSLYMSIVFGSPIIMWQLMAFFLPALKSSERKWFYPTFAAMVALFLFGNWFCYAYIMGPGFAWMLGQGGQFLTGTIGASQMLSSVTLLMLGFGISFQLPVIVFFLVLFNIVPYAKLRAGWRYVYVALMVVASVATPDWSPFNMIALFAVLALLYEGSMALARVTLSRRIARQRTAELELEP
jgi:sec-independent protein translocase protein TatC